MQYIILIILFTLAQALFIGHIHVFGIATPLFYAYYPMLFHRGYPRWAQLLLSFLQGLAVDMFFNTPGLAAMTTTLVGFAQPYILELFLKKEDAPDLRPSIKNMGFLSFFAYAFILTLLFTLVFFALEAFSFDDPLLCLASAGGSMLLTLLLILTVDTLRR